MLVNIIAIDIFGRKRTALSLYLALALGSFAVLAWSSDAGPARRGRVLSLRAHLHLRMRKDTRGRSCD